MREHKSGVTKALWLRMLNDGGYSTLTELSNAADGKRVNGIIDRMTAHGYCKKFRHPERKNGVGYGITTSCKVPREVTLAEILSAAKTELIEEERARMRKEQEQ